MVICLWLYVKNQNVCKKVQFMNKYMLQKGAIYDKKSENDGFLKKFEKN